MRKLVMIGVVAAMAGAQARAATDVTVYGFIDEGVTYIDNVGGSSQTRLDDSVYQGNRLGFRGREELGDGLAAVFTLEQGFSSDTGALRQGGLSFGRAAFVGLDSGYGRLTFGRQLDQMSSGLIRFHPSFWSGIYSFTPGDADRVSGAWLDNSIAYNSPSMAGVRVAAQVGLKEDGNGATHKGRAWSASLTYSGAGLNIGAAVTDIRGYTVRPGALFGLDRFLGAAVTPATLAVLPQYRSAGVGVSYELGAFTPSALLTHVRFDNGSSASAMKTLGAALAYKATPNLVFAAGVQRARFEASSWRTANLSADLYLSRRTDIYAALYHQATSGAGTKAVLATLPVSADTGQAALRVGIRHRF